MCTYRVWAIGKPNNGVFLNVSHWQILDEELEELCLCEFQNDTKEEKEQIKRNVKLSTKLIALCIKHFNDYIPKP